MRVIRTACIAIMFTLCGCQAAQLQVRPPLAEEGEVYVYLQPVAHGQESLSFTAAAVSALPGGRGEVVPLTLSLSDFSPATTARQRLIAWGRLPPGSYAGLSFSFKRALIKTEGGEADLLVSREAYPAQIPFMVERKRATALFLSFDPRRSIQDGISFAPSFVQHIPGRPVTALTGLVSNSGSHTVTVFDKRTGQVADVIATGNTPRGMALDRLLARLYVALSGDDAVEVIDIASGGPFGTIRLSTGDRPQEVALTPDGRTLLVVNSGSGVVSFADTRSLTETSRIPVGNEPRSVLIDSSGRRAYVFNTGSSTVSVLDVAKRTVVATLSAEGAPLRGQLDRRGDRLFVIHEWSPYISVFDTQTLARTSRIHAGMGAVSLKIDAATNLLYLGRRAERFVDIFSPLAGIPVSSFATDGWARYLTIDGEQNLLYLVMPEAGLVGAVSLASTRRVYELDTGEEPYWISVMGER